MLASRPTSAALAQDAADAARPSGDAGRVAALARAEDLSRQVFRLFRADRFREAEPLAREALRIRELHLPPDSEAVAQAVLNLGAQLHGQARWSEARPLYERALGIRERVHGARHPKVGLTLNNLASLLRAMGAYADARSAFERALSILEASSPDGDANTGQVLHNLSVLLREMGKLAEARRAGERGLAIRERVRGPGHPDLAQSLDNLGVIFRAQGRTADARQAYERSLAIYVRAFGEVHPDVAASLHNLAVLLDAAGSTAEARPLFERALQVYEQTLGADHSELAHTLVALAELHRAAGEHDAARRYGERALMIRKKSQGEEHADFADSLALFADLRLGEGAVEEAARLYEQALAVQERALGRDHPRVADTLDALGHVRLSRRALEDAEATFDRALRIREQAHGVSSPLVARSCGNLAAVAWARGDTARAADLYLRSLALIEADLRGQFGGLSARQRLSAVRSIRFRLDRWLAMAPRTGGTGYAELLRFRGLVARTEAADRALARRGGPEWVAAREALAEASQLVSRLSSEVPAASSGDARAIWQRRYAEAAATHERLARDMMQRSAPLRGALERHDLGLSDVTARLGPDAALVDFALVGDRYLAWIVRAQGAPTRIDLAPSDAVSSACSDFVASIEASDPAEPTAAAVLRDMVWAPVESILGPDVRRVWICPDAALASIPFAALPGRRDGARLIDEYAIAHVYHPFDLVPLPEARPVGSGALVVGGVDYERTDAGSRESPTPERPPVLASLDRAPRGPSFAPIHGTKAEAEGLRDRFGSASTTLLGGATATEARLRVAARGKRYVHIATHGFARDDLFAGLHHRRIAEAWTSADVERQIAVGHDPMLLSGLALAGANTRDGAGGDDGILTALEASYLDLDAVDLVTLSACETAAGTAESGEGVLGLVSAFRMAGARRVLASLWRVDDEATRRLMDGVYERILRPESPLAPADALREAALALRGSKDATGTPRFAATRYWAAFVAYGG